MQFLTILITEHESEYFKMYSRDERHWTPLVIVKDQGSISQRVRTSPNLGDIKKRMAIPKLGRVTHPNSS